LGTDAKLQVKGFDDLLVYRAKCCNPIRGEEVIGYITRGKGVCRTFEELPERAEPALRCGQKKSKSSGPALPLLPRLTPCHWTILTEDRPGMLAEIAAAISEVKANILNVEARTADERGTIDITVEIPI